MTTTAKEKYTQSLESGSTIGDAYRAAADSPGNNPAINESVKETARSLQFQSLTDRFGKELAGSEAMTIRQLENIRKNYENRSSDYQDQGMLYKQHLDQIDNEIARKKAQEAAAAEAARANAAGSKDKPDTENMMANIYVQFNNREISGPDAIKSIARLREHSPLKAAEYEAKILGGGANPAAQQTYLALNGIIEANKPDNKADPQLKMEYEDNTRNVREAIFQAFYDGAKGEELASLVEGYRKETVSKVLQEAFKRGNIGESGLFGSADKTATAFAFHSNQGNLDLRYSERTRDARMPEQTTPLTVGGDKAEQVLVKSAEQNQQWANKELEKKGIRMTVVNYERDSRGDRDGRINFSGSDGRTYRVNASAENGKRFLERLENGRWVKVDISKIPDLPKKSSAGRFSGQDFVESK